MPEETKASFRLVTLGTPRLDIVEPHASARSAGPGKGLAILAYLALAPARTATRDTLCDLLWGDRELAQSRPQLRQTLWLIKTHMHAEIIRAHKESIILTDDVTCDVHDFLDALRERRFETAAGLYGGDFFSGFASPGSGRFEEWASLERIRLRRLFVGCAESLMRAALDKGHFSSAIAHAHRVRQAEPDGQTGWRLVIEARLATGDTLGARAEAEQFEQWLDRDDWAADPPSRALLEQVKSSPDQGAAEATGDSLMTELVGRNREFAVIHDLWAETRSKGTRFAHLTGHSGIGKTRLIRDLMARLRVEKSTCRYVRANYGERMIPFSFAAAVATDLSAAPGAGGIAPESARVLVSLNPSLSSAFSLDGNGLARLDSRIVGLSLLDLFQAIADEDPVALCIDDLQWMDSSSREAMSLALSRLGREQILILSAGRPSFNPRSLGPDFTAMELPPLAIDDVAQLVGGIARMPDDAWARDLPSRLWTSSGGNPLHIVETLRHCVDAGLMIRNGQTWECPDPDRLFRDLADSAAVDRQYASLSPGEREVLLQLAVAGIPLPRGILSAAMQAPHGIDDCITSLEQKGLLTAETETVSPAHDSVAERVLATAASDAVNSSHRRLGYSMSELSDPAWRRRSIWHLAAGGDLSGASRTAAQFVRHRPAGTDAREIVGGLLGTAASEKHIETVLGNLSFADRRPELARGLGIAGAVLAFAVPVTAAIWSKPTPVPSEVGLMAVSGETANPLITGAVSLRLSSWDMTEPLLPPRRRSESSRYLSHGPPLSRPGRREWVENLVFPDSGEGDMVLVAPGRSPIRLTAATGDDRPVAFSPDGEYLLFMTTRWSAEGWSDIAILDMRSRDVRRLTHGGARFGSAGWSPDGSRIALAHDGGDSIPPDICIVNFDGSSYRCLGVPRSRALKVSSPAGWIDTFHFLVRVTSDRTAWWSSLDTRTGTLTGRMFQGANYVRVDPTGRWILLEDQERKGFRSRVAPAGSPESARFVSADSAFAASTMFVVERPLSYVDSISIEALPRIIQSHVPHQISVSAWTRAGRPVEPAVIRWRSLNPAIADVDSLGVIIGKRPGIATVEASLGGWRVARQNVQIGVVPSRVLMKEDWADHPWNRWTRYGIPQSHVLSTGGKTSLVINGDDDYFSGTYSRREFPSRDGIALDFEASTPVNRTQWQTLLAGMAHFPDAGALKAWDHRTGYVTPYLDGVHSCSYTFPHGEGPGAIHNIPWLPGLRDAMRDSTYRLEDGQWYSVRVQFFPDGRCGLAINGHAVEMTSRYAGTPKPMKVVIQGNSVGTTLQVRGVVVRSSVPDDVDWGALQWNGKEWLRSR